MRRFLLALALILALVLGLNADSPSPTPPVQTTQIQLVASSQTFEDRVQNWINRKRVERGRPRLRFHACTDKYAERWAHHLADSGRFYHQSLTPFFNDCHARYAGEVIAHGYDTPRQTVRAWMHSDAHRKVMLRYRYRRIGVGAVWDGGRWVVVADLTRLG